MSVCGCVSGWGVPCFTVLSTIPLDLPLSRPAIEVFFRPDVYSVKEGERVNITLVTNRIFAVDFEVTVTLRGISATGAVNRRGCDECL